MQDDVIIRPAETTDAASIVEVIQSGIPSDVLDLVIYGCDGVARYVRDQVAAAIHGCETNYTVAEAQGRIVGCVELRSLPDGPFVNYISILPEMRSRGLGRRVLRAAVESACPAEGAVMRLDVLEANAPARAWYAKLSFQQEYATAWWDIPLRDQVGLGWSVIRGMPQSRAAYRRFGFSQFEIVTAGGAYVIGMMGRQWFRVADEQGVADQQARATLCRLEPSRRMLAIVRDDSESPAVCRDGVVVARLHRLCADLREVMSHL